MNIKMCDNSQQSVSSFENIYDYLFKQFDQYKCIDVRLLEYDKNLKENDRVVYNIICYISNSYKLHEGDEKTLNQEFVKLKSTISLSDDSLDLLLNLDFDSLPPVLSAKIFSVIWIKKHKYEYLKNTVEFFLRASKYYQNNSSWLSYICCIEYSLMYSKKTKDSSLIRSTLNALYFDLDYNIHNGACYSIIKAIKLLIENSYLNDESKTCYSTKILNDLIHNIVCGDNPQIEIIKDAYKLKSELNQYTDKNKWYSEYADTLLRLCDNDRINDYVKKIYVQELYLKEAIKNYRQSGEKVKIDTAFNRLIEIQSKKSNVMDTIYYQLDTSKIDELLSRSFDDLSFSDSLFLLTIFTEFDDIEKLTKQVVEETKNTIFNSIVGKSIINHNGQTIFELKPLDIDDPIHDPNLQDHLFFSSYKNHNYNGALILEKILCIIRDKFVLTETFLSFLIDDHPLIFDERKRVWKKGLFIGLSGDLYSALHILVPQIEAFFRNLAKMCGDVGITLECNGTSQEKLLKYIFEKSKLIDCYDENILFTFRGLLNEKSSANFRNLIAHGLLEEEQANSGIGISVFCLILKLIFIHSKSYFDYWNRDTIKKKLDMIIKFNQEKSDSSSTLIKIVKNNLSEKKTDC